MSFERNREEGDHDDEPIQTEGDLEVLRESLPTLEDIWQAVFDAVMEHLADPDDNTVCDAGCAVEIAGLAVKTLAAPKREE